MHTENNTASIFYIFKNIQVTKHTTQRQTYDHNFLPGTGTWVKLVHLDLNPLSTIGSNENPKKTKAEQRNHKNQTEDLRVYKKAKNLFRVQILV